MVRHWFKSHWIRIVRTTIVVAVAVSIVTASQPASAQDEVWQPLAEGMSGNVNVVTVFNGDLIAGGSFTSAGGIPVNSIARWNGSTWQPLGTGIAGGSAVVYSMCVWNGSLYVGGLFTSAGSVSVNNIARWDGTSWHSVASGVNGTVRALTVWNNALYLGGEFTNSISGGTVLNHVARWTGTSFAALIVGGQRGTNDEVRALTAWNGLLVVGGFFTTAGGLTVNRIAAWNGTVWSSLSSGGQTGVDGTVRALVDFNGDLIVGGTFLNAGNQPVSRIARWNGSTWQTLASGGQTGVDSNVFALGSYAGELIVGGAFLTAGGHSVNRIARWTGSAWQPGLGVGMDNTVNAVAVFNNELIAGGVFTTAGGVTVNRIARTSASSIGGGCPVWRALGPIPVGYVNALASHNDDVYVGGAFPVVNGSTVNNIVRWDGTSWLPLESGRVAGVDDTVNAIASWNGDLYLGGSFFMAGEIEAQAIARWDGTQWHALISSGNNGVDGTVTAMTVWNNQLVVAGEFTTAGGVTVNHIARWDGSNWHPFTAGSQTGVGGVVAGILALTTYNGDLIATGEFETAGGQVVNNIARWNGTAWLPLTSGSETGLGGQFGAALHVWNANLIVGGRIATAGGQTVNNIARWDGNSWHALISGGQTGVGEDANSSEDVYALTELDGDLIVGGNFNTAGGQIVNRITRWDGTEFRRFFGGGMNSNIFALINDGGTLIAGGNFVSPASRLAQWQQPAVWVAATSGTFSAPRNWEFSQQPAVEGSPTYFGFVPSTAPFAVAFSKDTLSESLCITNQRPLFDLNTRTYEILDSTTIGAALSSRLILTEGMLISPAVGVGSFGMLGGDGSIVGQLNSVGTIRPWDPAVAGASAAGLTLLGNYSQVGGMYHSIIGPAGFGSLSVGGQASLGGTLRVDLHNNPSLQLGQEFPILTCSDLLGSFDAAILPYIGDDLVMQVEYVQSQPASGGVDGGTALGPGGGVNITIGAPNGSPNPDDAQNLLLTGIPTGVTGAVVQLAATESDLALSIADPDPQNNGNIVVLLNNGGGASFTPIIEEVGKEPSGVTSAALADGPEVDDFAVPNRGDNTVSVLFHEGSGVFTTITVAVGSAPSAIATADFDGDGSADLAVTNRDDDTVTVLLNNGDRTFTTMTPIAVGSQPVSIAAANVVGGALPDLIVANYASHSVTVLRNTTGGNLVGGSSFVTVITMPVDPQPIIVKPTDVDNDRDLDIMVSSTGGGSISLVKNLGGGVLSSPVTLPMDGVPGSVDAWDMDKDGDEDVVVIVFDDVLQEPVIRLLRNDSTPTQIAYTVFDPIGQGENPQLVNGSDVSGDTLEDLVSINVTPSPLNSPGGLRNSGSNAGGGSFGPSDSSMSIRRMLLGTEPICRADVAPVGSPDNTVGVPDLLFIINNWGPCANPRNCPADIAPLPTGDGTVGVPDLLFIINNWGPCP